MKNLFLAALCLLSPLAYAQNVTLPDYERIELDNGAVLILNQKDEVPLVAARIIVRGGAASDPAGKGGLANLFASLLEKGAGGRDAAAFATAVDSVGGSISAGAGKEAITINANFLADDTELMVELLSDMLVRPQLDADEMSKLRDRSVNFIKAAKDSNLNALLGIYGDAFLFGDHPYGNPVSGSEASLQALTHDDLLDFYAEQVGADRLVISVSGDFRTRQMRRMLTKAFGEWRKAGAELSELASPEPQTGRRLLLVDKPGATQTYFWIGNIGVARDFEQRADLDLANTVFGGRFTSMLNTELRVKSGLTYGARSSLMRPSKRGGVAIRSYTKTESTVEAIDMALGVLGQLRDSGIDDTMIESAQNYVLGQFPTRLETASQLAGQLANLELYGLDDNYINDYGSDLLAANSESIRAVIDAVYPASDDLVFVLLGDAEKIREEVARYGASDSGISVKEVSINEPTFRH